MHFYTKKYHLVLIRHNLVWGLAVALLRIFGIYNYHLRLLMFPPE
jgi:aspartate-semialdehyde dehydrogenase